MNRRQYRDAVLAALRVGPFSATDVVDSQISGEYESRPRRYIVVFTHNEATDGDRATGPQVDHDARFTIRSVGKTPSEAMFAADHVLAKLMGTRLDMPGRNSRPMRLVASDPMRKDPDVGSGLFFYDDEWSWFSTPGRKS